MGGRPSKQQSKLPLRKRAKDSNGVLPLKCVFVGDPTVQQFRLTVGVQNGSDPGCYMPTVQELSRVDLQVEGTHIHLELWETPVSALRQLSFPETDVFIICFSRKHKNSFDAVREYVAEVRGVKKGKGWESPIVVLLGLAWKDHYDWTMDEMGQSTYTLTDNSGVEECISAEQAGMVCKELRLDAYFEATQPSGETSSDEKASGSNDPNALFTDTRRALAAACGLALKHSG